MNPTRACTLQDLGLMRLEDALKWIKKSCAQDDMDVGDVIYILLEESGNPERFYCVSVPAKSYAVSVVERNKNTKEIVDLVKYNSQFNTLSFYKKHPVFNGYETLNTMYHTTNPFEGLVNADGTPVTSVTRETLDMWRREERG